MTVSTPYAKEYSNKKAYDVSSLWSVLRLGVAVYPSSAHSRPFSRYVRQNLKSWTPGPVTKVAG